MLALVVLHLLVAMTLYPLAVRNTRGAFVIAAVPPVLALAWVLLRTGQVVRGEYPTETFMWAPTLGLEFAFQLDALGLLMTLLVAGFGALVLIYSRSYFRVGETNAARSAPLLSAFAGVMLGLVWADDLLTIYVFWELTTIVSFLLIGQSGVARESRRSAVQALLITTLGGLVMLVGFIVLGEYAGTYRVSELAAWPPTGTPVAIAAALILVGALTKSAQFPFHNWLPAAMVAPTPISAYLHAASMVKAGVFLIAKLAPVLVSVAYLPAATAVFGLATMLLGGWRALREYDMKLLLAYGTVSQLGFLMVLAGAGTHTASLALAALLLAHGTFKGSLFLVVGIVDHQAGTRDIRELSGLASRLPVTAAIAIIATVSMVGLPPMAGFLAKEAAFAAFLSGDMAGVAVEVGFVVGSALTVAYSLRLLWGGFANKPGHERSRARRPATGMLLPAAISAVATVVAGLAYSVTDRLADAYADYAGKRPEPHIEEEYHLGLWHGFEVPLLLSAIAVAGGVALYLADAHRARDRLPAVPDAQHVYERAMGLMERGAVAVTGRLQVGSLPTYLGVILLTVLVVPGSVLLLRTTPIEQLRPWDRVLQLPLALVILIAAAGVVRATRRLTAVLLVGVIGYGIGGMFVVGGGPDLALTQFLVETLTVVAFVLVLRRLPAQFTQTDSTRAFRLPKALLALAGGVFIASAALIFSSARDVPSEVGREYIARAEEGASATNVVNAIIVDFRAFDTVGEITVLAVTATGVASLVLTSLSSRRRRHTTSPSSMADDAAEPAQREVAE